MTLFYSPISTGAADRVPCTGRSNDWLEPTRNHSTTHARIAYLKSCCAVCPVIDACRTWAIGDPEPCVGMVAGGLTTRERNVMRLRATARANYVDPRRRVTTSEAEAKIAEYIDLHGIRRGAISWAAAHFGVHANTISNALYRTAS